MSRERKSITIGRQGEKRVALVLDNLVAHHSQYTVFADYTFRHAEEQYAQIDFLCLSPYGLFVIEVKNYDGVVCDSKHKSYVEQKINGKTYYRKNPHTQNKWHTFALSKMLDCPCIPLCVFAGDAQVFMKNLPLNLFDLQSKILSYKKIVFSREQLDEIARLIDQNKVTNSNILARFSRKEEE